MMRRHFFAPGVIDGPHRAQPRWPLAHAILAEIRQYFLGLVGLVALCLVLGFAAGYLGWLS